MQGEADESVGVGTGRKPLERKVAVTRTCTTCNGAGKTACRFCRRQASLSTMLRRRPRGARRARSPFEAT
jgi:DnaJ-class molecular chaperone